MPTEHGTHTDRESEIHRYASEIMVLIAEDQDADRVPLTVSSFSDLHEHVDANDYAAHVGLEWGEGEAADLINDVETEVSRRLGVLAGANPGEDDCSACGKFLYRDGTDIAVHWATPHSAAYRATSCSGDCSIRIESARNAKGILSPANVRTARKLYLIETKQS